MRNIPTPMPVNPLQSPMVFLISRGLIIDQHASLFEAMDAVSSETMDCYQAIIDQQTDDWKDDVKLLIGEDRMISSDILLIKRLELEEGFRGKGIGAQVALEVTKRIGAELCSHRMQTIPAAICGIWRS